MRDNFKANYGVAHLPVRLSLIVIIERICHEN